MTRAATVAQQAGDDSGEMIETLQALLEIERERADALKEAVRAARRTGIAVGLVMARNALSADDAFTLLHTASHGIQLQATVEAIISGRLVL